MPRTTKAAAARLTAAEREVLDFFVHLGKYLSLPRTVGEIYGFLFATGEKHTLDSLVGRLGISKGSASQGLRALREAGAVRVSYVPGDRKDYYQAEVEFPALVRTFLQEHFSARLDHAGAWLDRLQETVVDPKNCAPEGLADRVGDLQSWHRKARRLVPLVKTFLKV